MQYILFDLSSVIVHPYFNGLSELVVGKKTIDLTQLYGIYKTKEYRDFMVGKKTENDVIVTFLNKSGLGYSIKEIRQVLQETPGYIKGIKDILEGLNERYILYCLTNEGNKWIEYKRIKLGLDKFISRFVSSEDLGVMKPDKIYFKKALELLDIHPKQCLFIDDSKANCASAKSIGIDSVHFLNSQQLRKELKQRAYILNK